MDAIPGRYCGDRPRISRAYQRRTAGDVVRRGKVSVKAGLLRAFNPQCSALKVKEISNAQTVTDSPARPGCCSYLRGTDQLTKGCRRKWRDRRTRTPNQ